MFLRLNVMAKIKRWETHCQLLADNIHFSHSLFICVCMRHDVWQPHPSKRIHKTCQPAEREKCQKQSQLSVLFLALSQMWCWLFLACLRIWPRRPKRRDSRMKSPSRCPFLFRTRNCCVHAIPKWKKRVWKMKSGVRASYIMQPAREFEWWRLARTSWRSNAQINQLNKLRLVGRLDKSFPLIYCGARESRAKQSRTANMMDGDEREDKYFVRRARSKKSVAALYFLHTRWESRAAFCMMTNTTSSGKNSTRRDEQQRAS